MKVITRTSPNYEKKALILKTDLCKRINLIDRRNFNLQARGIIEDINFNCDEEEFLLYCDGYKPDDIKEARKINNASYHRALRLKERIARYLLKGRCVFATLTFNDYVLNNTSEATRRRYVARFLKSVSDCYVANIDYGGKQGREHYHALIVCNNIPRGAWSYGFDKYEKVRCDNLAPVKIAKYISKLTNHAIKDTTKRCCYIYSRDIPKSELLS